MIHYNIIILLMIFFFHIPISAGKPKFTSNIVEAKWQDINTKLTYYKLTPIQNNNPSQGEITLTPLFSKNYITGEARFQIWVTYKSLEHNTTKYHTMDYLIVSSLEKSSKLPLIFKQTKTEEKTKTEIAYVYYFQEDINRLKSIIQDTGLVKSTHIEKQSKAHRLCTLHKKNQRTTKVTPVTLLLQNKKTSKQWILSSSQIEILNNAITFFRVLEQTPTKDY